MHASLGNTFSPGLVLTVGVITSILTVRLHDTVSRFSGEFSPAVTGRCSAEIFLPLCSVRCLECLSFGFDVLDLARVFPTFIAYLYVAIHANAAINVMPAYF